MPLPSVLILGSGYTGSRVAKRLTARGVALQSTHRHQVDATTPQGLDRIADLVTPGCTILHSIPGLPDSADRDLVGAFGDKPRRVVYLSTTGVYGAASSVDERTPVVLDHPRVMTEQAIQRGPWESLILRPAAIYGPGRGVHIAMADRRYTLLEEGWNFISRIHVDDLAAITEAALLGSLTGAYPVADLHPCQAREIADYCSELLDLPPPVRANREDVPVSRRANRQVDGSAICRELGVTLLYPSYRQGIPAAVLEETRTGIREWRRGRDSNPGNP